MKNEFTLGFQTSNKGFSSDVLWELSPFNFLNFKFNFFTNWQTERCRNQISEISMKF